MAEQQQQQERGALDQNQLCCSVCLDLLKEPVTLPCGHNYCKSCIKGCWDQEEQKGVYSCPQCRETFKPRPLLRRNNVLAEILKKTSTQQASPPAAADCAGPADVPCDFCSKNKPNKATMSCLTCLASYCPAHLEPHHSVPVLKKHQLVSATVPLQDKMCTKHNKLMEVYCQTDKKCICYLCIVDEHKTHQTVSAAAQRAVEQNQLLVNQKEVQKNCKEREEDLKKLVQAMMDFKRGSKTTLKTSDEIFDELISSIKKKRSLVKQLMKAQETTAIAQAEELQVQLEEEISKLRTRDAELKQLSHVDDHIHFIQSFQSLTTSCPDLSPAPVFCPPSLFKTLTDHLSKTNKDVESLLNDAWPKITATVSTIDVVLPPVPKTREEFIRYCCPLTLDQNSASMKLSFSQEYRRVMSEDSPVYQYGSYRQQGLVTIGLVLCTEGLSQRYYWEVTFSGWTWSVAVSYNDISGDFGNNNSSWSLECSSGGYSFQHDSVTRTVSGPQSSTIGVYLDYHSGTLSFYSVSDTMTLLHKECTTFTQPLYPGLMLWNHASESTYGYYAELVKLW